MKFEKISKEMYENFLKEVSDSIETNSQFSEKMKYFIDELSIPKRATKNSAGHDFYAPYTILIHPGEVLKLGSGIKAKLEPNEVLLLLPRSSIGIKKGISLANTVGVVDSDYYDNEDNEGHIIFFLKNNDSKDVIINQGDRFAQGLILTYSFEDKIIEERRGGFGSTNTNVNNHQLNQNNSKKRN